MIRIQMRNRAKNQRCATFNKFRKSLGEITLRKSLLGQFKLPSPTSLIKDEDNHNMNSNNNEKILQKTANITDIFDDDNNLRNSRFEQLLKDKESSAPFDVADLNLISTVSSSNTTTTTSHFTNTNTNNTNVTTASSKTTVYGSSVIMNRKIPHVNITMARKMSLFLGSTNEGRGVILLAGQTISLMDLIILWNRMSILTKSVLIIFIFTFILHIYFAIK